jgi:hypothetical protein
MTSLILSLLPSRVLSIVELFGYIGDRHEALKILMQAGGWTEGEADMEPAVSIQNEGIRRPLVRPPGILEMRLIGRSVMLHCSFSTLQCRV